MSGSPQVSGRRLIYRTNSTPPTETSKIMTKLILEVPEISCDHCAQTITKALWPRRGVLDLHVDVPAQTVHLELDESTISLDEVKRILADEEYPVAGVAPA